MNGIKRLVSNLRAKGIGGYTLLRIKRILGIDKIEDSIASLNYFLNVFHSCRDCPSTDDNDLRIMQLCDFELLSIFDLFCKKHNLNYWLDYGTLLGAYRHSGFIPWDDDLDVSMMREDYNQLLGLGKELEKLGLEFSCDTPGRIGISFHHKQTGVWLDVFPRDLFYSNLTVDDAIGELRKRLNRCRVRIDLMRDYSESKMSRIRDSINDSSLDANQAISTLVYLGIDFYSLSDIHPIKNVHPLSLIEFEGRLFPAPSNTPIFLEELYGKSYMHFPTSGVLHHDGKRGALSTWAQRNNIDMHMIREELIAIQKRI